MATILDLSILEGFSSVFVWVLVWVLSFAFLEVTNLLKNRQLHAAAALCIAVIVGFSGTATQLILYMGPWILIIMFIAFILFMIGNFMGIPGATILQAIGGERGAIFWVFIPLIILLITGLSSIYGQGLLEERTGDGDETEHQQSVIYTLTSPQVLGLVLIMLIAVVTITFLTGPARP